MLVKEGLPEIGVKLHAAPVGSPSEHDKLTGCVDPLSRVPTIMFEPELPAVTVMPSELDREKLKEPVCLRFMSSLPSHEEGFTGPPVWRTVDGEDELSTEAVGPVPQLSN